MSHRSKVMSAIFHKPSRPKVQISVLSGFERDRWFCPGLVVALLSEMNRDKYELLIDIGVGHFWVEEGRNKAAKRALAVKADWLFFLDSDVEPPPKFMDVLDHAGPDQHVIALPYFSADVPPVPTTAALKEGMFCKVKPGHGFQEIGHGATGAMFISRTALEKIPPPHFVTQFSADGLTALGEDYNFCEKARKAGFKIWTNGDYPCEHYHTYSLSMLERRLLDDPAFVAAALGMNTQPQKETTPCP